MTSADDQSIQKQMNTVIISVNDLPDFNTDK